MQPGPVARHPVKIHLSIRKKSPETYFRLRYSAKEHPFMRAKVRRKVESELNPQSSAISVIVIRFAGSSIICRARSIRKRLM